MLTQAVSDTSPLCAAKEPGGGGITLSYLCERNGFLTVQVPGFCILSTPKQSELCVLSEHVYFPVVKASSVTLRDYATGTTIMNSTQISGAAHVHHLWKPRQQQNRCNLCHVSHSAPIATVNKHASICSCTYVNIKYIRYACTNFI